MDMINMDFVSGIVVGVGVLYAALYFTGKIKTKN